MILRCKPLLGTFVEMKVLEENSQSYLAVEEALEEIEEIHNLMSFFDEKSEVSLLNKKAHKLPIKVDERLFEVLTIATKLSKLSNGIFDITLHRAKIKGNYLDIKLLEDSKVFFEKELNIDLGGIAKGYAVDRAADILESYNIKEYIINAGGDLRVGEKIQEIDIRNPQKLDSTIYKTNLQNLSLATSSGYFSYKEVNKKRIYPIFQARNSALEYRDESTSVITKKCIYADALTKIVAILKEGSRDILLQLNAKAVVINPLNQVNFIG